MKTISIIIPVWNEAENLKKLLPYLKQNGGEALIQILVIDGGSTDETKAVALNEEVQYFLSPEKGRAAQMNYGAKLAKGEILYFVHADTLMPSTFSQDINDALKNGFDAGCYRYIFDSKKLMLKFNAYCTRFDSIMCRGGDQTLFIKKEVFESLKGFRSDYKIMEEYEFIIRLRKGFKFYIIPKNAVVSARKYETNSYLRVNLANFFVFMLFFTGASQDRMTKFYKWALNYR